MGDRGVVTAVRVLETMLPGWVGLGEMPLRKAVVAEKQVVPALRKVRPNGLGPGLGMGPGVVEDRQHGIVHTLRHGLLGGLHRGGNGGGRVLAIKRNDADLLDALGVQRFQPIFCSLGEMEFVAVELIDPGDPGSSLKSIAFLSSSSFVISGYSFGGWEVGL